MSHSTSGASQIPPTLLLTELSTGRLQDTDQGTKMTVAVTSTVPLHVSPYRKAARGKQSFEEFKKAAPSHFCNVF